MDLCCSSSLVIGEGKAVLTSDKRSLPGTDDPGFATTAVQGPVVSLIEDLDSRAHSRGTSRPAGDNEC